MLHAVERQFRKTGYAGTSLDDLCAVTGLGRGSLYAAFGDKHALFLQALGGYCDRAESILLSTLVGPDDEALLRLRGFLTSSVEVLFDDSDRLGCMVGKFAVELAAQDVAVADRIQQDLALLQNALIECVRGAQRNGDLDPDVPPDQIACLLVTISRGIDVVIQAGSERPLMESVADRAFACLPLTAAGRRLVTAPV